MDAVLSHIILRYYAPTAVEQEQLAATVGTLNAVKSAYFGDQNNDINMLPQAPIDIGAYPFVTEGDVSVLDVQPVTVFEYNNTLCSTKLHDDAVVLDHRNPVHKLYNEQFVCSVVVSAVLDEEQTALLVSFVNAAMDTLSLHGFGLLSAEAMSDEGGLSTTMLEYPVLNTQAIRPEPSRFETALAISLGHPDEEAHFDVFKNGLDNLLQNALPAYPAEFIDGRSSEDFPHLETSNASYSLGTVHALSASHEGFCGQISDGDGYPIWRVERDEVNSKPHFSLSRIVLLPRIENVEALFATSRQYPEVSAFSLCNGNALNTLAALSMVDALVSLVGAGVDTEFHHNDKGQRVFKVFAYDDSAETVLFEGTEGLLQEYFTALSTTPDSLLSIETLEIKAMELGCSPSSPAQTKPILQS